MKEPTRYILPSESKELTPIEYAKAVLVCEYIEKLIKNREEYICKNNLDSNIHNPMANWDSSTGHFKGYYAVATKSSDNFKMLRLFTQVFTGHYMGLKLVEQGMPPIAVVIPDDFDQHVLNMLEEIASLEMPIFWIRYYFKLIEFYPQFKDLTFPIAYGESGFLYDNILVNHDLYVYLERIGLMEVSGVLEEIKGHKSTIVEIGSGFGGLAYLMKKIVPNSTYICVDLPESLSFAALYLSRFYDNICFVDETTNLEEIGKYELVFIANYMFDSLVQSGLKIDLAINTLSMSEMTSEQIRHYCQGISTMIGKMGAFFEQNQDNRHIGFTFANEIVKENFKVEKRLVFRKEVGMTQGVATLWTNS